MSLIVQDLTKRYGDKVVVDHLSRGRTGIKLQFEKTRGNASYQEKTADVFVVN